MALEEKTLRCRDCGQEFLFTVGEQEFYASHGLQNDPTRCPACRANRRRTRSGDGSRPRQMHTVTCAECGAETQVPFEPTEGRPVYCRECYARQKKAV
ncbi:MAG: zinc-ribbon domain containing protein [Dehalococcoidales bacterium]|nr:zinc-ribbon domain containing protein [Dehalococcoidales bacterium]